MISCAVIKTEKKMIREATALLGVGRDTQLGSLTQEMQAIPRKKRRGV